METTKVLKEIMNIGINGGKGISGAKELADIYLQNDQYGSNLERIDELIKWEIRKNFTSGFLTSLGGILTLPLTIPSSLGANWILQTRMVAAVAHIAGFKIDESGVRMAIGLSLLGNKGKDVLEANASDLKNILKNRTFHQLPKRTILILNQAIGTRLVSLATQKGFTKIGKAIPIAGGLIGGFLDQQSCSETAKFALELFQLNSSDGSKV
ncbi:MAG: EcsC family protein [Proteobacteria bacterium]|nr:EcsC family protein [Pseudomonadota bacterium]